LISAVYGQSTLEKVAKLMSKHQYSKVYRCFDDNMKSKVPVQQLKELWEQMESVSGKLVSVDEITIKPLEGGSKQTAVLTFERAALNMQLVENEKVKLAGLFLSQLGYQQPAYANGLGIGKKYINFVSDTYTLSGELVIPLSCNNCPVVILVHGSGPNDKDETIGPNKVFYDLSMGLASKGVATFRYDKRSNLYPETLEGQFDLYDETINDAIEALYTIKKDTALHFGKHVMLGHSLGAFSMPLIADSLGDQLDGAILFSANARRLEDLIEYQMEYLTAWDGEITKEEADLIKINTNKAANIRIGNYTTETAADSLLAYWPGKFWKGIETYNPVDQVRHNSTTPFYILQGERDYQITMTDFDIWKKAVGDQSNVSMKNYIGLSHLFTPSTSSKSGPNDYFIPNNVDYQVIGDIAQWVLEINK